MRVKSFRKNTIEDLEKEINSWFEEDKMLELIGVTITFEPYGQGRMRQINSPPGDIVALVSFNKKDRIEIMK